MATPGTIFADNAVLVVRGTGTANTLVARSLGTQASHRRPQGRHVFSNIWYDRDLYELNSQRIQVVSRKGLIAMKQLAGRTQDLADIEALEGGTKDE